MSDNRRCNVHGKRRQNNVWGIISHALCAMEQKSPPHTVAQDQMFGQEETENSSGLKRAT